MYDIAQAGSLDECKFWLRKAREHIDEETPILLVGNKSDRVHERGIDHITAKNFACKWAVLHVEHATEQFIYSHP
jgi:GTPase SAR1 family protein